MTVEHGASQNWSAVLYRLAKAINVPSWYLRDMEMALVRAFQRGDLLRREPSWDTTGLYSSGQPLAWNLPPVPERVTLLFTEHMGTLQIKWGIEQRRVGERDWYRIVVMFHGEQSENQWGTRGATDEPWHVTAEDCILCFLAACVPESLKTVEWHDQWACCLLTLLPEPA